MGLFGDPRVTHFHPRIIYGAAPTTIDFDTGLVEVASPAILDQVRSESISPSGRRKVLFERTEELRQITWAKLDANKVFELSEFFRSWGGQGKQFELYLDRFTGAFLEFEGTLADQQGTLGTFTGTPSYEAATFGQGLRLGAGEFLDFPTAPASQQPSMIAAEGIVVLVVKPSFAGTDGVVHSLLTIDPTGSGLLLLQKDAGNNLVLFVEDGAAGVRRIDMAVSWAANSEQKVVAKWKDSSSLELWLNGIKGPAPTGAGTGVLPGLPTSLRMGARLGGTEEANGLYDRLGFFARAFDLNASTVNLLTDGHFPRWKNYYAKAEAVDLRLPPEREVRARELFRASMIFRAGVA